ncbi:MAG: hypothetical protein JSU73_05295 [candidate division WOR-3 bacterium]|nr:MAG: hypothetical protein JSU73_05295 [candidate division WOR-3 bacterium]
MRRLAVSMLLVAMSATVTSADWDYSSQKFGAGVGVTGLTVCHRGKWFPYFPNFGVPVNQFWGRRFGLSGIRLLERCEFHHHDVSVRGSRVDAELTAKHPLAPYSSVSAALSAGADLRLSTWRLGPSVGVVLNQNDRDFLVGSRELWYEGFGLRAGASARAWLGEFYSPTWWQLSASVVGPYTVRFDWGRVEAGPLFRFTMNRPVTYSEPEAYELGLDLGAYGGKELTDISQFPEEHEPPGLGWIGSVVPKYRVRKRQSVEGDPAVCSWHRSVSLWLHGIVRIPVVAGLHIEPALTTGGGTRWRLFPDFWPSLSFGYVHAVPTEKYLAARLETSAPSLRVWESPQLSLAVSYGCREVTRVGDDETMQGPGGTVNPWQEQHQNPSP